MQNALFDSIVRAAYSFESMSADRPDTLVLHPEDEIRLRMECQSYVYAAPKYNRNKYPIMRFYGMDVVISPEMPEGEFSVSKRSRITVY